MMSLLRLLEGRWKKHTAGHKAKSEEQRPRVVNVEKEDDKGKAANIKTAGR